MISTAIVDQRFDEMIKTWRISSRLGITPLYLQQLRFKNKRKYPIRLETKLRLLQRYGFRPDFLKYTDQDLAAAIRFYINESDASKAMGVEYVIEKFIAGLQGPTG